MRVLDAISDGAGGPVTVTVGSNLNGPYFDFESLRDDKVLVITKWDGVGEWNIRIQAMMNGATDQVLITQFFENEYELGATNWTTGAGPYSHGHDTVNNTYWFYLPKLPRMRARVNAVAAADTDLQVWFIA